MSMDLFAISWKTRVRRTDPESSKTAAKQITKTGRAATQSELILHVLQKIGSGTSKQIAAAAQEMGYTAIDRYAAARRLPELVRCGKVCMQTFSDGRENVYSVRETVE